MGSASGAMRLIRPVSTLPGPTSMNVVTPAAAIRSTAPTQSTPAVRCSTSSVRQPSAVVIGRPSALASSGDRRVAELDRLEDASQAVGGLGHERGVGGDRDGQHDRALGAEGLRELGAGLDGGALARDDDLAGRVPVGDDEHAVRAGALDEFRQPGVVEADEGGHRAIAALPGGLHQPAPLADEPDGVGEVEGAGRDHRGVLAHGVPGGEGGPRRLDARRRRSPRRSPRGSRSRWPPARAGRSRSGRAVRPARPRRAR